VSSERTVSVTPCGQGGPLLLRGADHVVDAAGVTHEVDRPVVALCSCEKSQRLPWCDGTHRAVQRAQRRRATLAAENRTGGAL
jgi:CDGSH-type Zn-finger protein